ncbi:MAG: hypothetical protein ACRDM1_15400 [Gaiellaceae bacterium]
MTVATTVGFRVRAAAVSLREGYVLGAIVALSFVLRALAAAASPTPTYFPDEYIYSSLGRSLGTHGAPSIRGHGAHFPALLEPLLAAPLWRLFSTGTAYHLIQVENALFMSAAAVPAYLLARRLKLGTGYSLGCALAAVAVPDLALSGYVLADPIAYPLVLAAVYAAVRALETPSLRGQAGFLLLASLASFARVQFVVLFPAYLVAGVALDRRRVLRTQRAPLMILGGLAAATLALGTGRVLGYYSAIGNLHVGFGLVRWAGVDLFLLAIAGGVVLVPGAMLGLATPRTRGERAFSAIVSCLALLLLVEAGAYASNGSARFQERYLCALLPIVPIAFSLYARRGRPGRHAVFGISAILLLLSARLPLSGYAAGTGSTDSPLLSAVLYLERLTGVGDGAAFCALFVALGALAAGLVAQRGGARWAFAAGVVALGVVSFAATKNIVGEARHVSATYVATDPSWVDRQGLSRVTAVQTAFAPPAGLLEQLFWNRSVTREVVLGSDAAPTDAFAAARLRVTARGALEADGDLTGPLLVQEYAVTTQLSNARLLARRGTFALWQPSGAPHLRSMMVGRFSDGWLSQSGRLTVWPTSGTRNRATVSLTLSVPAGQSAMTMRFGDRQVRVWPGRSIPVMFRIDTRGPWTVPFSSSGVNHAGDLRPVSVRCTSPRVTAGPGVGDPPLRG